MKYDARVGREDRSTYFSATGCVRFIKISMANTVFLLGAGASKRAGAPLMGEFLDVARDLWRTRHANTPAFSTVFAGISHLQQVHSKAKLDIHNVESVFAAFEMSKTLGRFADYTRQQIDELVASMREVIVHTLDATIKIPCVGNRPQRRPLTKSLRSS